MWNVLKVRLHLFLGYMGWWESDRASPTILRRLRAQILCLSLPILAVIVYLREFRATEPDKLWLAALWALWGLVCWKPQLLGDVAPKYIAWIALVSMAEAKALSPDTWHEVVLLTLPAMVTLLIVAIYTTIRVAAVRTGLRGYPLLGRVLGMISISFYICLGATVVLQLLYFLDFIDLWA